MNLLAHLTIWYKECLFFRDRLLNRDARGKDEVDSIKSSTEDGRHGFISVKRGQLSIFDTQFLGLELVY